MSAAAKSSLTPAKFLEAVRKGKRFEIVLLRGEEDYLLREALQEYISRIVTPESVDFNYQEFRSGEVSGETLWNALITLPFMGDLRLVVLDLSSDVKKDVIKALAAYSQRPSATTSLVLIYLADGGRLDWGDQQPESLVDVEFKPLNESERAAWAEAFVKCAGKSLHREAVSYLVQTSAKSISDLAAKLNHAVLFSGDETEITVQTLMKVSGVSSEFTVFQLEDAILRQRHTDAHRIACSLLEGGEALLRLLAVHRGTLIKLWQISRAIRKNSRWQDTDADPLIKSILGRQDFKMNDFKKSAQKMGEAQLRKAVLSLLELEITIKTGSQEPYLYFEWLWRVCGHGWKSSEPAFQLSR
jgi:DNA polymerase III subunit delta